LLEGDGFALIVRGARGRPVKLVIVPPESITHEYDPATLTLDAAVELLAAKTAGGGASGGRELGSHPDGGKITLRAGRFGPYVNWGKVNATLPKSLSQEDVTLEDALRLIEAKAGAAPKAPVKKTAAAKARKKIEHSDEAPFEDAKPVKAKTKKPPAKKAAQRKSATK
ncbi:MAG: DNA topoisomerase I, partial [Methylocystis sp.]|nr:DNA topoisomerase I [Methylocystis sp.]